MIELNHYIKDARNAFLFWHDQGKPRNGNIFETRKDTEYI